MGNRTGGAASVTDGWHRSIAKRPPVSSGKPSIQTPLAMRPILSTSRLSWPVQALLVCGAFLLVGLAVVDDYGPGWDATADRVLADKTLAFIMGDADRLDGFHIESDKYYGMAFELPLLLLERGLRLADSHGIYLLRHLATHGFFLLGGWGCSLLVYRLTHSRAVALFALLVFVLQPRLYAHSFFNSKDLPFLSMFMVTLYVTHRAFRKETVGAFVLCGVCVGILTNLRIMGVMLYPAVLVLRGLDLMQASRRARKHVVVTGSVFALAGPCTLYVLSPYLWADPLEFLTAWQTLTQHPLEHYELFQGRVVSSHSLPQHYIPTWVAISTPLVTLLGGGLGVFRIGIESVRRPRAAVGNTDLRFGLVLVVCLALPVVAIIALGAHAYHGPRHVFFLYAPLCSLAGLGVQWAGRLSRQAAGGYACAGVGVVAGIGVLVPLGEMVRLHPHQQEYLNRLVDRTTPEALRHHYVLDPWSIACREGLEFLRRRYPDTTVYVRDSWRVSPGWKTLPQADRARLVLVMHDTAADFEILCGQGLQTKETLSFPATLGGDTVYVRKVYKSTLLTVTGQVTVPHRARSVAHRVENTYRGATAGELLSKGRFDIYTYPGSRLLAYARAPCTAADVQPWFFVHIFPVDTENLPWHHRRHGFDNRDFFFGDRGQTAEGRCWVTMQLPAYEIARLQTGQYTRRWERLWTTELAGPLR